MYAARHRNGARAAIKILHRELADDENLRRRFLREALIANSIDHPSVVRVLDDDEWSGEPFLVMELVEGRTLADLAADRTLDQAELLDVAEQLLEVLAVAHAKGVIHRDLKPQNLLLDPNGRVRILDFGIARVLDEDAVRTLFTTIGAIWGTLEYMAPELLSGSAPAGVRTDVYGVGATLFTLATNEYLHDEADTRKRVLCAVTRPGRSLAAVTDRFGSEVAALIDRATSFAPEERWESAAQMLREVRRLRSGLRTPDWSRRKAPSAPPLPGHGGTRAFGLPAWVRGPARASSTRPYRAGDSEAPRAMAALQRMQTQRMDLSASASSDMSAATAYALPEPALEAANVQYAKLDESGERPRVADRIEPEELDWTTEGDPEPTVPSGRLPAAAHVTESAAEQSQPADAAGETVEPPPASNLEHPAIASAALPSAPDTRAKRTIVPVVLAACVALAVGMALRPATRTVAGPQRTAVVGVVDVRPRLEAQVPTPPAVAAAATTAATAVATATTTTAAAAPEIAAAAKPPTTTPPAATASVPQRPRHVTKAPAKTEPSWPDGYKDLPAAPY
ncbi:MAG: serine/threonine protein kinase [Deltaproteobacteria bacterium]|nr:serine/threonine protein kinase [Deltaproteobacteria bacterium]